MVFSSLIFLYIFLPVCVLLYFAFPQIKAKNAVLIAASLLFYAMGEPVYVFLLIAISLVNFLFGLFLGEYRGEVKGRLLLFVCCVLSLSGLIVFKYAGFFVSNFNALFGTAVPVPNLTMPIGISFFTFQTLTYTVDVYRGKVRKQRSFWRFLLYVSMFPQLIAGPIVRYSDVEPQLEDRTTTVDDAYYGIFRFFVGLGKKVLLANYAGKAASLLLDGSLAAATVAGSWFGILMYAFEIYFDFSGYSDMAIGLGRLFGFKYNENFNLPYIANSISDFWRRWHISLSSFFRDYVYIPLGGNRVSNLRWVFNVFVVWGLTGFWHGANWNFILWGLYFFVLLLLERPCKRVLEKIPNFIRIPFTFFLVLLGWTFFYFTDINRLSAVLKILFGGADLYKDSVGITFMNNLPLLVTCAIGCTPLPRYLGTYLEGLGRAEDPRTAKRMQVVCVVSVFIFEVAVLLFTTVSLIGSSYNPFLYFRF